MSTPQENALNGAKKKSQKQIKLEQKEAWKNRHNDPTYKALTNYKTVLPSEHEVKKKVSDWAGDIGRKHIRNQKAETDKGYREGYR